jgi:hypothetical protein
MTKFLVAALVLVTLLAHESYGDGIGFKGNRISKDIPTTVLELTKEQRAILDTKPTSKTYTGITSITLTENQKKILRSEAGFAPDALDAWPFKAAKGTCTCELLNIGVRYKRDKVEVPHFLLGKNHDDRGKSRDERVGAEADLLK